VSGENPGLLAGLVPGVRATLRRRFPDGFHDLLGFVVEADEVALTVEDRHGERHLVRRADVVAGHRVGVARGRDPLRTPVAELAGMASRHGLSGTLVVGRLSDLLDDREPPVRVDEPAAAWLDGDWLVTAARPDLLDACWWAARRGARSLLVVAADAAGAAGLPGAGLTVRE
jgi:hypothetical protein